MFFIRSFTVCVIFAGYFLLLPAYAVAEDLIGSMIGSIYGSVTAPDGSIHQPSGDVDATVDINTADDGTTTATVTGRGACNAGLGVTVNFTATYNSATNTLSGTYTDAGSQTPREIIFSNTGGLNWTANVSGSTPSEEGLLPYDLIMDINLPNSAIYPGSTLPSERTYDGPLSSTIDVSASIIVPGLINETVNLSVLISGTWSATSVPQDNGSGSLTGTVNGTLTTPNPTSITVSGTTILLNLQSTFSGTLNSNTDGTIEFQGSWSDVEGFGGPMDFDIPVGSDGIPTSIDASFDGGFSVDTPMGTMSVPFNTSGSIPFIMN